MLIALAVMIGKSVVCSMGMFFIGHDARTSLRTGLCMAQIGEFSFVIATLGLTLGAVDDFIYPIAVAAALICMLTSPYLLRSTDLLARAGRRILPRPLRLLVSQLQRVVGKPASRQ